MRIAALLVLAGCSQIFGLSSPKHAIDAPPDDVAAGSGDASIDIPDAAPGHCVTQADCPTSVCLPSTVCADSMDVAWLSSSGVALAPCTMQAPCNRLGDALNTAKPYIRVIGKISNTTSISQDVAMFGELGAGFTSALQINSGKVGLYTLDISNSGTCIQNSGGMLTAEHITVHDCTNIGINSNGTLILDGSTITGCRSGGVIVQNGTFVITNNFITLNGTGNMTQTGGLTIQAPIAGNGSRIDFNTIAVNAIKSSSSAGGGIYCNLSGFVGVGDVVVANTVNGSPNIAYANTGGQCTYTSSVIQPSPALGFVSAVQNNFHITSGSALRDAAALATGPATDVDGESRPYGSAYDIGADEYHP